MVMFDFALGGREAIFQVLFYEGRGEVGEYF